MDKSGFDQANVKSLTFDRIVFCVIISDTLLRRKNFKRASITHRRRTYQQKVRQTVTNPFHLLPNLHNVLLL